MPSRSKEVQADEPADQAGRGTALANAAKQAAKCLPMVVLAVPMAASAANCTNFMIDLLMTFHLGGLACVGLSTLLTLTYWASIWAAFALRSRLRDLAVVVCAGIMGLWLAGGVRATPLLMLLSVVGCMLLVSLASALLVEEKRTGSPTGHSLYRFFNAEGRLLYIGITDNPRRRFREHGKTKQWWPQVAVREIVHLPSRVELVAAERAAIIKERPLYNIAHAGNHR